MRRSVTCVLECLPVTCTRALALIVFLWACGATLAHAWQDIPASKQTVWDRVFSPEQSERGKAVYLDECGRCHAETLTGSDFGPTLVGGMFWDQWNGKTIADVFERIRTTMPQDNPGRLSAAQTSDVLAFLMKSNGLPSGEKPLTSDPTALRAITVTPTR